MATGRQREGDATPAATTLQAPSRFGTLSTSANSASISRACFGVAQDSVRTIDFYLASSRRRTGIDIAIKPLGQLAVCRT